MPADQFRGDFLQDALDLKSTALARDLRVHQNQQHDVAQFFPQIFVVLLADRGRDFVGFLEQLWHRASRSFARGPTGSRPARAAARRSRAA